MGNLLFDGDLVVRHVVNFLAVVVLLGLCEEHLLVIVEEDGINKHRSDVVVVGTVDYLVLGVHLGDRGLD